MLIHFIYWLLLHTDFWIDLGHKYKTPSLSPSVKNNKENVSGHSILCLEMKVALWQMQSYRWSLDHEALVLALNKPSVQWGVLEIGMHLRVKPEEDGCQTQQFRSGIRDQFIVFPTSPRFSIKFFSEQVFPGTPFQQYLPEVIYFHLRPRKKSRILIVNFFIGVY